MERRTFIFSAELLAGAVLAALIFTGLGMRTAAAEDEILREAGGGGGEEGGSAQERLATLVKEKAISDQALFAKADRLYLAGLRYYEEWQYEKALKYFERAVETYPNHPKAREYLRNTRAILNVHKDKAAHALETLSKAKRVRIQELLIEIGNGMDRAKKHWKAAQTYVPETDAVAPREELFSRAIDSYEECIKQCDRILEIIRWLPYKVDLSGARKNALDLRNSAELALATKGRELETYRRAQALHKAKIARTEQQDFESKRLAKLIEQAERFYRREQYAECEQMCMHILDLDPLNGDAQGLKLKARVNKHEKKEAETYAEKKHQTRGTELSVEEAGIPYAKRIVYPEHWEQILARSDKGAIGASQEPAWMKAIRSKLDRKVSFEFVDTPLSEAINFLQTLTHVNMIIDPRATGGGADVPINLKVSDMSLGLALEWILKLAELDYALKDNAIFISKPENLRGEVVLKIYDVRDLTAVVEDFPGPDLDLTANTGGGGGGGGVNLFAAATPATGGVTVQSLAEMIQSRVKPDSWAAELGTSIEERGGQLVVMQRPEVHRLIDKLLESFRERQKLLVTVEARFLTVQQGVFEDIGVSWSGLDSVLAAPNALGPDIGGAGTVVPNAVETGFQGRPDTVDWFGRGTMTVVGAVTNQSPGSPPPVNFTPTFIGDSRIEQGPFVRRADQMGLSFQVTHLGRVQAMALIHALKTRESLSELAAPRLTVMNTQRAHMFVAEQTSYLADYEISGDAYDPIIRQFLRGVVFDVKPIVSSDRRYVTLELRPTKADLINLRNITISAIQVVNTGSGGVLLTVTLPFELPEVELQKVRTTVTIPDGGIILIGGMMHDVKFQHESGVPFLSNIPIIGKLFRWNTTETEKSNLMILVTARILLFDEEERKL